ncbi:hypothetical protein [Flavihumibacter solisilvae]|uniref:Uncharacterized protein n=1 Tax=Flavihumibacter solisilvae TaxID=1349421 RepID=A0A0C1KY40_9BACT|nr:hypothetical protein [Flavihumibacter solisilvae]KIC92612.1 hypothetical protein OI18_21755 [Flavihumibacter solisilvae]
MTSKEYFQPCTNYFWQLEDDGEVIAVPGGRTIGYSRHLIETLEPLSAQGLPPFGAFLLVMVATNEDSANKLGRIKTILQLAGITTLTNAQEQIKATIEFLEMISTVFKSVLKGKQRVQLLQVLFAESHGNCSLKDSKRILEEAKSIYNSNREAFFFLTDQSVTITSKIIQRDIKCIDLLRRKFSDTEKLIKAIAALPEVPEIELPKETSPGDLLEELLDEPRTFLVASLVKHLWSGLRIPFHQSDPSDQPFGGISDLSNKGDFDKLLVSEYANDNLVFLSRLANNEALYLYREAPPANPDAARTILADVSIRNWGTPKLIAYGIMLALYRHPKTNIPVHTAAIGSSVAPVLMNSKEELINSLRHLDAVVDPAAGLRQFLEQHTPKKSHEVILVIAAESLETTPVQKVLGEFQQSFKYLLTVDHSGLIRMYQNSRKGRIFIQQLELPLAEIWKNGKPKIEAPMDTVALQRTSPSLPPLLYQYLPGKYRIFKCDDQEFILSSRYLFMTRRTTSSKGLWLTGKKIQTGASLFAMAKESTGTFVFLSFNTGRKKLEIVNFANDTIWNITFTEWRTTRSHPEFFFHKDCFWYMTDSQTYKFDYLLQKVEATPGNEWLTEYHEYVEKNNSEISVQKNGYPILKNANYVGITTAGHLRINNHQLVMHERRISFEHVHGSPTTEMIRAERKDSDRTSAFFVFNDGSSVTIYETGVITLVSSHEGLPAIHLPAVLDTSGAMATATEFSGNEYYLAPENGQKKISVPDFYNRHIVAFIHHIFNHETGHRTRTK